MAISSSAHWSKFLSSCNSSLSGSSSPGLTRQGSMLGLKTCQLSAPTNVINAYAELQRLGDLRSGSSRRLQNADYGPPSRRSTSSFGQIRNEDFFTNLGQEAELCLGDPDCACNNSKQLDRKYDGIAMPWSSPRHRSLGMPLAAKDLFDVYGELTSDDVDLLPLPGLLTPPSVYAEDPYTPQVQVLTASKAFKVSSPETSAGSCKSSVTVSDYLGLPPDLLDLDVNDNLGDANTRLITPARSELDRGEGMHRSCTTHARYGKETDDFSDSLAGMWSNTTVHAGMEHMLLSTDNLSSVFNVYPQNFNEFYSSEETCFEAGGYESAQLIIDDLECLVESMKQASDDGSKAGKSAHILSHGAEGPHLMQSGRSTVVEAMQTDKQPFSALVGSQIGEKQGTMTDFSALDVGSHVKKNYGSVGLKRPFSVLDIHRMTSPAPFAAVHSSGSNVWRTEPNAMGLPTSAENCEEQNRESSSVYMSGKDPMRAGVSYQQEHATATDDETMLKPPPIKVRRKHGMAMDPQSIAARTRRERFSDRIRILQNLVPNAERLDTVAMLGQTLEYVRFLQHQVWQLYHGNPPASPNSVCEKWKGFVEAEYAAIG